MCYFNRIEKKRARNVLIWIQRIENQSNWKCDFRDTYDANIRKPFKIDCCSTKALRPVISKSKTTLGLAWNFEEFTTQMAETFIHKQLDKLTNDIHRRTIHRVNQDSKHRVLHCDFSQHNNHAMADQSMCEFFDIISSSLFIAIACYWDPQTDQLECEGWMFISYDTSQSNNHMKHYLQQIHEHYTAFHVQHNFGCISTLTVWADNCTE